MGAPIVYRSQKVFASATEAALARPDVGALAGCMDHCCQKRWHILNSVVLAPI